MDLDMFISSFECLCGNFILPESSEHVYTFARTFLICEKYYTLSRIGEYKKSATDIFIENAMAERKPGI